MIFMQPWGQFGVILGGVGVTLGSLSAYKGDFGLLWGHFRYTKVALDRSWGTFKAFGRHFGDTLASLLAYGGVFGPFRGHFEVALGSVWVHFGVTFGV